MSGTPAILAAELPGARGGLATAAALATAIASDPDGGRRAVLLIDGVSGGRRGPTLLSSPAARRLEGEMCEAGLECVARGRLAWLRLAGDAWVEHLEHALGAAGGCRAIVVTLPIERVREVAAEPWMTTAGVVLRADLPRDLPLAALSVAELGAGGTRVRISTRAPGRVACRRALAGIDPGGEVGRRSRRLARGLLGQVEPGPRPAGRRFGSLAAEGGQVLPVVLGAAVALVVATLGLATLSGAVAGKSRAQRAADLIAVSAARQMRDDFDRLFASALSPDGSPNPEHLDKAEYLQRAREAAGDAAERNGVGARRVRVHFPDARSFAPLRIEAHLAAELDLGESVDEVAVRAEARAAPLATATAPAAPAMASGGGYSGPLVYRQGEGMRPDVAEAFDLMEAQAADDGVAIAINDGFRSDAEQAVLWAANPDPRWVARPGSSLHRCATELDLGPPAAYSWLASHAEGFGFLQRYPWEAWHYGFVRGPAPCAASSQAESGDGEAMRTTLPAFVPGEYRGPILTAARTWNVSGALLAAQLMAESNFNPFAVSSAGAAGIAQFMPATAAAYGLADPLNPDAAIDAQAHLMSDLLGQFGQASLALAAYNAGPAPVAACGCIPPIPETQAYVARILALIDGAGASVDASGSAEPRLDVQLVG